MATWTNAQKNGGNQLTWNEATFQWEQADPNDTWNENYIPFVNDAKSASSTWTNKTKDATTFINDVKH